MASAAGPIVSNNDGAGGNGVAVGIPPSGEESIEFLQREIEVLKRRLVDERHKLGDRTIVQVHFYNYNYLCKTY